MRKIDLIPSLSPPWLRQRRLADTPARKEDRPITMIVPFPAGGGSDSLARILADHMKGTLGQPIVVENVTGASGSIGVARAVRARRTATPSASDNGRAMSAPARSIRYNTMYCAISSRWRCSATIPCGS